MPPLFKVCKAKRVEKYGEKCTVVVMVLVNNLHPIQKLIIITYE